jgi:hypothetical protein
MVNLGKEFRGDQVLSCRSLCRALSRHWPTHPLMDTGNANFSSNEPEIVTSVQRIVNGPIKGSTTVSVTPPSVNEGRRLSRPGHESFTLAFCFATRRCMNLGPSFL